MTARRLSDADVAEVMAHIDANGLADTAADGAPAPRPDAPVEPLADPAAIRFGRFLESDPPVRQMLIADLLPLNVVGILAALGGAGKSVLTYQLAMSIAAGLPWIGMQPAQVGGVLYLATEDDEDELHRRGRLIVDHYAGQGVTVDRGALAERLHVFSRIAEDTMLTRLRADGEVRRTEIVDRLVALCERIADLKLVVLDTTSRLRGGQANVEEHATRYVEALEAVRQATRATVLTTAHVSQMAAREPGEVDQTAVRGSTALVDGARWLAVMRTLRRDDAEDYGVERDEAKRYLRLDLAKANYVPPWPGIWLYREAGGVLVPTTLERQGDARRQARQEERYGEVLERLIELLRREGALTRNQVRPLCGQSGVLRAGDQTVRGVIERAIQEGALVERADGSKKVIDVPAEEAG